MYADSSPAGGRLYLLKSHEKLGNSAAGSAKAVGHNQTGDVLENDVYHRNDDGMDDSINFCDGQASMA